MGENPSGDKLGNAHGSPGHSRRTWGYLRIIPSPDVLQCSFLTGFIHPKTKNKTKQNKTKQNKQ
jgi:hypothetical protein